MNWIMNRSKSRMKKRMFATDVISQVKRQRNAWKVAAIASLILNVIQFICSKIVVMSR